MWVYNQNYQWIQFNFVFIKIKHIMHNNGNNQVS